MLGHVLAAAGAVEPEHLVAVVGHGREQVGPHVLELVPDGAARRAGDAGGHRPRRPGRGRGAPRRGRDRRAGTVRRHGRRHAAARGRDAGRAASRTTRRPGTRVTHPDRRGRRPLRLRPDPARRRRATSRAIVEEKDATRRAAGDPRDQRRHLRLRRRLPRRGAGPAHATTTRKGEYYLTDVVAIARPDGRTVGAHVDRRRRRRPRAPTTGPSSPRSAARLNRAHPRPLDARRRDGRRPRRRPGST